MTKQINYELYNFILFCYNWLLAHMHKQLHVGESHDSGTMRVLMGVSLQIKLL